MSEKLDGQAADGFDGDVTFSEEIEQAEENIVEDSTEENRDDDEEQESLQETSKEKEDEEEGDKDGKSSKENDSVQKRINKIHREKKEAEELLYSERQHRERLEQQLKEYNKVAIPDIPPVPDYLDADYDDQIKRRDEIIAQHAELKYKRTAAETAKQESYRAEENRRAVAVSEMVKTYGERSEAFKLDKKAVEAAGDVVGKYITGKQHLAEYLLSDENGPLNVSYLSQNIEELDKVSRMTETAAAVYIATKITPKAIGLKPKTTKAPNPQYSPKGNGRVKSDNPELDGCTFT